MSELINHINIEVGKVNITIDLDWAKHTADSAHIHLPLPPDPENATIFNTHVPDDHYHNHKAVVIENTKPKLFVNKHIIALRTIDSGDAHIFFYKDIKHQYKVGDRVSFKHKPVKSLEDLFITSINPR